MVPYHLMDQNESPNHLLRNSQYEKLTIELDGFIDVMGTENSHFENNSSIVERQVIVIGKLKEINE